MKLHAIGGTTSGSLVLFWPEQLPADFDERFDAESAELLAQLQAEGKLLWLPLDPTGSLFLPSDADGDYALGLYLQEPIPDELQSYCTLEAKCDALHVAGEGWFSGVEFLFRDDRSAAAKHPRRCTPLQIPPGVYSAEVFATDIPDEVYETWLRDQAGSSAQRWWWIQTWIASAGVVTLLVFVVCLFFATRQAVYISLGVSSFFLCIAWLMSRTPGYQRVQQARRDYQQTYPDYVVRLR